MDPKVFVKGEVRQLACSARERVNLIARGFKEAEEVVTEAASGFFDDSPYTQEHDAPNAEKAKRGPGRPRKNQND